ncbi:N-acetylglucosamine-6-phosphate deacetylase [Anaerocolumna sp.]|uniref:N-acetylglucosamine-6-phosphate deacetylase n=1 Tax=Anaerocolumna sp. TaxID=2041569 RepID=UPI0028B0B5ED|nr:N-acetylglucosamine-6-phosphate deacetylase [Anaerocolumna sp.]
MRKILINGKVITPLRIIENAGVIVENGVIEQIIEGDYIQFRETDLVIDVKGQYISPGFIDIHTHGGGGHDFMDGSVESIIEASRAHMRYGTTSIVPTTLTSNMEDLFRTLDYVKESKNAKGIPNILGIHLEGPYFSMEQRGAQDPKHIMDPQKEAYTQIIDYSNDIVRWTIAPELPGALEMGRELSKKGIICSIGHSNAIYEDVVRAYENGFNLLTHFYSGMSMVKRINSFRYAGVVESGYLIDDMFVEVIADGMHLPESLLKLIYKVKGPDKICLVTDSMRAAGCPEGEYVLGNQLTGQKVIVEDGVAKLPDRRAFAGSVATADRLVRTMVNVAQVPLTEAVKMITLSPARVMRIEQAKGSITPGKDADLIVFDENIRVQFTMIQGEITMNQIEKIKLNMK